MLRTSSKNAKLVLIPPNFFKRLQSFVRIAQNFFKTCEISLEWLRISLKNRNFVRTAQNFFKKCRILLGFLEYFRKIQNFIIVPQIFLLELLRISFKKYEILLEILKKISKN